ncbi:hypothetical protein Nepgr_018746 [Nepenthes gracilis]|uniref:Uncharacterized protein n=1 Tax=Nepenthes gracilis TaxID=150966 RepID=A0AAD3XUK1_NEPGR|nr:hypothetical protein Nepgr_018746 [Nepenthes gracilis]
MSKSGPWSRTEDNGLLKIWGSKVLSVRSKIHLDTVDIQMAEFPSQIWTKSPSAGFHVVNPELRQASCKTRTFGLYINVLNWRAEPRLQLVKMKHASNPCAANRRRSHPT